MTCRARRADVELHRIGRRADGTWYRGRGPGRGAWWCASESCGEGLSEARLARALRCGVDEVDIESVRALVRESTVVVKE